MTTERRRPRDRNKTEADMRQAAVRLIRERGPLQGLSLKDVADAAGVNRVQIYQYYGTREALLRAAIHELLEEHGPDRQRLRELPFAERRLGMFDHFLEQPELVKLEALLALDDDEEFSALTEFHEGRQNLARDVEQGVLSEDADAVAMHVITTAAYLGYATFREVFARDTDIPVHELDTRVRAIYARMVESLTTDGKASDQE